MQTSGTLPVCLRFPIFSHANCRNRCEKIGRNAGYQWQRRYHCDCTQDCALDLQPDQILDARLEWNVNSITQYQFDIQKTGTVGAEVRGIDLACIHANDIAQIKSAWHQHDVLLFRNQQLTDDDLLSFSRHFGALDSPPNQGAGRKSPAGYPEVYVVSNVLDDKGEPIGALGDGEAVWHTDMSYAAMPPDASILYSLEIPAVGGDTSFASMKDTLTRMPRALIEKIKYLSIKHDGTFDSGGYTRKGMTATNDPRTSVGAVHPAIIQHPVSGAFALYLGRRRNAYVIGMELADSEALLDELWSYVDCSIYQHRWSLGDLVLWDNRTTMHRRDPFDAAARRVMHRTQIKGSSVPLRAVV